MPNLAIRASVGSALCALLVCAGAAPAFSVTSLGTLGGLSSFGWELNDRREVVGEATNALGQGRPFLWSNGNMIDLGTLGGSSGLAQGINNNGVVVGDSFNQEAVNRAFVHIGGVNLDLGALSNAPRSGSGATAISDTGIVVGNSTTDFSFNFQRLGHAFAYVNGVMVDLGTLGPVTTSGSQAADVNSLGQVVGGSWVGPGAPRRAVLFQGGAVLDLGTLGGDSAFATGINESGLIVGVSSVNSTGLIIEHAFLWTAIEGMRSLGSLNGGTSIAWDVNNFGQVVGYSAGTGFLFMDDRMYDLNDLLVTDEWTITEARAINNLGDIVAQGRNRAGESRALLLTPVNVGVVPSPGTLSLLLGSLAMLLACATRESKALAR